MRTAKRFAVFVMYMYADVAIVFRAAAQEARIINPPRSVNISLNGVAEYNCTGTADAFVWEFNKEPIGNKPGIVILPTVTVDQVENIYKSVLQVTASSFDTAKNITCTAISLFPLSTDESQPAQLMVQGLLNSVNNLTVTPVNSTTVLISWSPPFTLEGVPILGYNVTIYCTDTNQKNETVILGGETNMLYYAVNHSKNMNFTVVPINQVGPGQSAYIILNGHELLTSSVILVTSSTKALSHSASFISISISSPIKGISTIAWSSPTSTSTQAAADNTVIILSSAIPSVIFMIVVACVTCICCIIIRCRRIMYGNSIISESMPQNDNIEFIDIKII